MKLLFLTQTVDAGDAVLGFVPRWLAGLARHCEEVRAITLEAGDLSTLPENVSVRVVGRRGRVLRWLRYKRFLAEALREDGFDRILAHMVPRYALLARGPAERAGVPLYLWYTHAGVDRRLEQAVACVEKVFSASLESLRLDTPKRVVTGHGIDLEHFTEREEQASTSLRILSVGRLTAAKDPLTVLQALSLLVGRGRDLSLEWVGGGMTAADVEYGKQVSARVRELGLESRVHLAGAVPYRDVPRRYQQATLVVNASHTGSLDKTVLEAMASGRAVLSCNEAVPPVLSRLGDERKTLRFSPGDAAELATRIEGLLDRGPLGRAQLGRRLREIVRDEHEVEALMARLVREMEQVP
ncbi:MAG: glycosyltransferase family 4 protein [Planctomycetes bacterium]|nr:glycosyltransferase family 4 protein [Planctomycetota bacterium]